MKEWGKKRSVFFFFPLNVTALACKNISRSNL